MKTQNTPVENKNGVDNSEKRSKLNQIALAIREIKLGIYLI